MDGDAQGFVAGLEACFGELEDPRNEESCDHLLFDILAISVLAVACGADDWCDLATFAKVKFEWLKKFLALPGGAPSHDTFACCKKYLADYDLSMPKHSPGTQTVG